MNAHFRNLDAPVCNPAELQLVALAFDQLPVNSALLDLRGAIIAINERYARELGIQSGAGAGLDWAELCSLPAAQRAMIGDACAGHVAQPAVRTVWRRGQARRVRTQIEPLRVAGAVAAVLVTEQDVTEEMGGLQLFEERITVLGTFAAASGEAVALLDAGGNILYQSASSRTLHGRDPVEMRGRNGLEFVHPDDLAEVRARFASGAVVSDPLHIRRFRYRHQHADGRWIWIDSLAVNALADPLVGAIIVYARDATADVGVEEMLQRRERRFAALTAKSDDMIVVLGAAGDVSFESASVGRIMGFSGHELRSAQLLRLIHRRHRGLAIRLARDVMARHGIERRIELQARTAAGEYRWIEAAVVDLIEDPDVHGLLINARDITARKNAELRLAVAMACGEISLWEQDCSTRELHWLNHSALRRTAGFTADRLSDADFYASLHPQDRDPVRKQYRRLESGELQELQVEFRVRDVHGGWRWVLDSSRVDRDRSPRGGKLIAGSTVDITDLRVAQARLSTAVWGADIGLHEIDVKTGVANWHSGWCREQGIDPCDGPDHAARWDANIHPDDVGSAALRYSALLRGDLPSYECEYRVRRLDGEWLWCLERARAVACDATGRPERIVGTCLNIDARKRAEMDLLDSQAALRSISENNPDWTVLLDEQRRVRYLNRGYIGQSLAGAVGRPLMDLVATEHIERVRQYLDRLYINGVAEEVELVGTNAGGERRVLLHRATPIRTGGRTSGVVINTSDITLRRRQEDVLRMQAQVFDTILDGVVLTTSDDVITLANPAFAAMFGSSRESLAGQKLRALLPLTDEQRHHVAQLIAGGAEARELPPFEFECARPDGSLFTVACAIRPVRIAGAVLWLTVVSNVTSRKALERAILEASNREQRRIGNDLHDGLGQELTGVALMLRGLAGRIQRECPSAQAEVDDIVSLVNHTIQLTRTLAHGLSPVGLDRGGFVSAVRALVARARETAGIAITIRTRLAVPLRLDEAIANHLYRIAQEAISNAQRHSRATSITVRIACDESRLRLSIHDNGRGLADDRRNTEGLGLRIMRYRAHMIGGSCDVVNHRGGGVVVRVSCPHSAVQARSSDS